MDRNLAYRQSGVYRGAVFYSRVVPVPPILEIYVVWHPEDTLGAQAAEWLLSHFHSAAYAGLAGGAVEVYLRCAGWELPGDAPRPLPFMESLPAGLQPAQHTAVMPVLGRGMAKAVRENASWREYMKAIFDADGGGNGQRSPLIGVYPLREPHIDLTGTQLARLSNRQQALPSNVAYSAPTLARELAQSITQHLHGAENDRITVFISHTKHSASPLDTGPRLVETVRNVVRQTHLDTFFDAQDIQVGDNWAQTLDDQSQRHVLLMIRTDLYSSREWTQREVLTAKRHDLPVVALYAVREQEERGSFLMDHVPVIPCPSDNPESAIQQALNRLVDEALKRALWKEQQVYLREDGFDWLPVHAPEPVTVGAWLRRRKSEGHGTDNHVFIMHPDPPLGPRERGVILEICELAGYTNLVDILTPRTFASRGGRLHSERS